MGGRRAPDVLLLGAAGNSGALVAAELVRRGLSLRLAGRRRGPLDDLARALAVDGATTEVCTVDVEDAESLADAMTGVAVAVSTIGPFVRYAAPVVDAALAAGVSYVDIANEWSAVRGLLDRDGEARAHGVTLVTGAGFGPAATETLVMRLVGLLGVVPELVRVASAPAVSHESDGVRRTVEESLSQGVAHTYRDGRLVSQPLGTGATVLTFGGAERPMLPAPVGDLETARRASGAPNVVAYVAAPGADRQGTDSYAWAEVVAPDERRAGAELRLGEGVGATAAIAAETAQHVLAGGEPGAWTAGHLLGVARCAESTGADVTMKGPLGGRVSLPR
jgi:short subunit dehydrogenase-like uncharacterized protein